MTTASAAPPLLSEEEFLERVGGMDNYDPAFERDYALSRLTRWNCAVELGRPIWVIKGGFAVRHIYGSSRFSADADLSPMPNESVITGGAPDINVPPGMISTQLPPREGDRDPKSIRLRFDYHYRVGGDAANDITCDLNTKRPVTVLPVQKPTFESLWFPPFKVYAMALEEIVGEKVVGLLTFFKDRDRIKDAYDLWHIFARGYANNADKDKIRRVLDAHYIDRGVACPTDGLAAHIKAVLDRGDLAAPWRKSVDDVLPRAHRGKLPVVRQRLPEMAEAFLP